MSHEEELYELLKQGNDIGVTLPNNEGHMITGETSIYEDPEDRNPAGTTESPWGEKGPEEAFHHTEAAHKESLNVRHGVIDRNFRFKPQADAAAKKTISDNFSTRDYESHSIHLQKKTASVPAQTLMERVRRLSGRV